MEIIEKFNLLLENFKSVERFNSLELTSIEDIKKVPIATREDIQAFGIANCPIKPQTVCTTSGSTGKNVFLFHSSTANKNIINRILKTFDIADITSKDVIMNLLEYGLCSSGRLFDIAVCERKSSIIHFGVPSNEKWDVTLKAINDLKPNVLIATVSVIYDLLKESTGNSIKKIYTMGSLVTPSFIRKVKEKWDCQIYNLYACNEFGPIAFGNTDEGKLRLLEDNFYLEVLNEDKIASPTGKGKILVTDLDNFSTPLIRYLLGDEVEITDEKDGRFLNVFGRSDNFTNINCDVVSISLLIKTILNNLEHDKFFTIVSNDNGGDSIEVRIPLEDKIKIPQMIIDIKKSMGLNIKFRIFPGDFPMTASGKYINYLDKRKLALSDKRLNW